MANGAGADVDRAARIKTILGCFLAQNLVMGIAYGSFGPMLEANQAHMDVGRAVAAGGMSLITLALAVVAAIAGGLMQRFRVRDVLAFGVAVSGTAYLGLAIAPNFPVALVCYALVGIGVALGAVLAPLALVSRWVSEGRGKVLAFVNLPVILFACPFVVGLVLPSVGREAVYFGLGAALLALVPLLFLLVTEWPPSADRSGAASSAAGTSAVSSAQVLRSPGFWLISLGIGIMAGCGITYVVHIVAFGLDKGMPLISASALLSIYAGAGLVGTPLFGWLSDRLGPPNALVLSGGCQAVLWSMVLIVEGPALYLVAAGLGICCTPLVTLHGASLGALFDPATVARAMGYSYLVKLPFIFGFGPGAGALFDMTGEYRIPFLLCSALMACATLCFIGLAIVTRIDRRRHAMAAA